MNSLNSIIDKRQRFFHELMDYTSNWRLMFRSLYSKWGTVGVTQFSRQIDVSLPESLCTCLFLSIDLWHRKRFLDDLFIEKSFKTQLMMIFCVCLRDDDDEVYAEEYVRNRQEDLEEILRHSWLQGKRDITRATNQWLQNAIWTKRETSSLILVIFFIIFIIILWRHDEKHGRDLSSFLKKADYDFHVCLINSKKSEALQHFLKEVFQRLLQSSPTARNHSCLRLKNIVSKEKWHTNQEAEKTIILWLYRQHIFVSFTFQAMLLRPSGCLERLCQETGWVAIDTKVCLGKEMANRDVWQMRVSS